MKTVQILGIHGYDKTNLLRANVLQALGELRVNVEVEDVFRVEDLIRMNIKGIPALRVNGKIVWQQTVPDVTHLKALFMDFFKTSIKPLNMKNILVPIDFSETSKGAFQYALNLAEKFGSTIKVVYYFMPTAAPEYGYMDSPLPELLEASESRMADFLEQNLTNADLAHRVSHEVCIGFPGEEITRLSEEGKIDLIVMGTTGESGWLKKMFGSLSVHVAQNSHCPVFLVPNGLIYNPLHKILYATNYEGGDERMLLQSASFANKFEADIHLVHVREGQKEDVLVKETLLEDFFKKEAPLRNIHFANVESDTVLHGLEGYANNHEVDLVVLATKHRNFIEGILHKSLAKEMIFNTKVPLMILHYED